MARTKATATIWPSQTHGRVKPRKKKPQVSKESDMKLLKVGSLIEVLFDHENSNQQKFYKAKVTYIDTKKIRLLYEDDEIEYSLLNFARFTWRFSEEDDAKKAAKALLTLNKLKF